MPEIESVSLCVFGNNFGFPGNVGVTPHWLKRISVYDHPPAHHLTKLKTAWNLTCAVHALTVHSLRLYILICLAVSD